jgi:CRP-like cAMP-binding protein
MPVRNRLLAALPAQDFDLLHPHLERVALKRRQVLEEPHVPIRYVHFIERGAASMASRTRADGLVGVGLVGRTGLVGIPVVLGTMGSPLRCVVQIPGEALRIGADHLRRAMDRSAAMRQILLNYVQALMVQNSQLVLCNTRHPSDQRLARWLLLAHDESDDDAVCVTHAVVSRILGVRRATVTEAIGRLGAAGVVRTDRGCITIVDRARLEQVACECYRIIRAEYDRLVPAREQASGTA